MAYIYQHNNQGGSVTGSAALTDEQKAVLEHLRYDDPTRRLVSDAPLETTLNSLFLANQHKMSSSPDSIYFENISQNVDYYYARGGLKDHSDPANQGPDGVIKPTARVFNPYEVVVVNGEPISGTSTPYDSANLFTENISGLGIIFRSAENVPAGTRLKYVLLTNGNPVYEQFEGNINGISVDEDVTWYFDHPLDVPGGSVNTATIYKLDENDEENGVLNVCIGDSGAGQRSVKVPSRSWTDKELAYSGDIVESAINVYDLTVDADYTGEEEDGTALHPFKTVQAAVDASAAGNTIFVKGDNVVAAEIVLPHSLNFVGLPGTKIRYAAYDAANDNIFSFTGTDTETFVIRDIEFRNAGKYALHLKKTKVVELRSCEFRYNGWNGQGLNTVVSAGVSGVLGYDSASADLQAFYAGPNASNGGAIRIEECQRPLIRECIAEYNLRGFRLQDCGVNGGGFVIECQAKFNIESGIYLAAGAAYLGCQNITVAVNYSAYNANNGLLAIGGLNLKFSQCEVLGNWNAGLCGWGSSNLTMRDCGLYDNNRSQFNGIGNTGDAKASIQINDIYSFIAQTLSYNPAARFICEILDTQVHYTGLGSNTEKVGFLLTSGMGAIPEADKNIIKIDDVGFIGQDYAIDFSECDVSNLKIALGDNSYQSVGVKAVRPPAAGSYFELPFSNHTTRILEADFSVTNTGNVVIREGVDGNVLNPYSVNELQAVAYGSEIRVMLKDSDKIQFQVPVSGCTIDGFYVNSVLNTAVTEINGILTNTQGFSGGGDPVVAFPLSGNFLSIVLDSGAQFTRDVREFAVDTDLSVADGGHTTDPATKEIILMMTDQTTRRVSIANLVPGSTLNAITSNWFVSYGNNADLPVTSSINGNTSIGGGAFLSSQQPFYWGQELVRGGVFRFNMSTSQQWRLGVWGGPEQSYNFSNGAVAATNWQTVFAFLNGSSSFVDSTNTDVSSYQTGNSYVVANGAPLEMRFDAAGHLTLVDLTGGSETIIGKTLIPLNVNSFNVQWASWANGVFPNASLATAKWEVIHDFDGSEGDEILDGINDHTVLRSQLAIPNGKKLMFFLDMDGRNQEFGTGYTGPVTGNNLAEVQLDRRFSYLTNEALDLEFDGVSEWNLNTSAQYYFDNGVGVVGYRKGSGSGTAGTGLAQGMFSLRHLNDNSIELWSEDNAERVATAKIPSDGSDVYFYFGVVESTPYNNIPDIHLLDIVDGVPPVVDFAPVVADQSFDVTEGDTVNIQLIATQYIVNQWVEVDAPSWLILNQNTGVFTGTAPAFAGTAADTVTINCKAGNAVGGITEFVVTINVQEISYTNTKSLSFPAGNTTRYLSGNASNVTALQRAADGSGAGDAWSIGIWLKIGDTTQNQTVFYYGDADPTVGGRIEIEFIHLFNTLAITYGTNSDNLLILDNSFNVNDGNWHHLLFTYNGGETGNNNQDDFARFEIFLDNVLASNRIGSGTGFSGAITDGIFRIGKNIDSVGQCMDGSLLNQFAIWDSDQSANISDIFGPGEPQDLSTAVFTGGGKVAPVHYYEVEGSVTTIADINGGAPLSGFNFANTDLVNDKP